jgi:hypothetical protein
VPVLRFFVVLPPHEFCASPSHMRPFSLWPPWLSPAGSIYYFSSSSRAIASPITAGPSRLSSAFLRSENIPPVGEITLKMVFHTCFWCATSFACLPACPWRVKDCLWYIFENAFSLVLDSLGYNILKTVSVTFCKTKLKVARLDFFP